MPYNVTFIIQVSPCKSLHLSYAQSCGCLHEFYVSLAAGEALYSAAADQHASNWAVLCNRGGANDNNEGGSAGAGAYTFIDAILNRMPSTIVDISMHFKDLHSFKVLVFVCAEPRRYHA